MAVIVKLRLPDNLLATFNRLHPAYGEKSRVMKELLASYLQSRSVGREEQQAVHDAIKTRKV